ncbi:MAG TPA: 3-hydroxyacyl-CoA dehydrogenase NAD-binding domain-containing protein [Pyrinomonadaceae bacterium]|nr:3-hydroxyacyl-CoA dehydrogenase NAD-binding domain-containing protein [Pyrinomonadaceae bacterium]
MSRSSDESKNTTVARPNQAIAVLGAGTMGHGIAQVAAAAGYVVIMSDPNSDAVARGVQAIERNLAKAIQLKKISEQDRDDVLHRISCASGLEDTLGLEAMRMLEQGVASARDIDTAMELGYNHPMGLCG